MQRNLPTFNVGFSEISWNTEQNVQKVVDSCKFLFLNQQSEYKVFSIG